MVLGLCTRRPVILAVIVLLVTGCAQYSPHPWTTSARFDLDKVQFVAPENLSRVKANRENRAVLQLADTSFVRLSAIMFADFSDNTRALEDGEIAYLVRGVTWFRPPSFSVVALDAARGELYVVQYAGTGELMIPFGKHESVAYPIIGIMDREIVNVHSGAVTGGDSIWRWRSVYGDNAWDELR